jgi:phosphoenolpyruvate phosphomutase
VDVSWAKTYEGRDQHPVAEAELVKVEDGKVVRIGKGVVDPEVAHGEFIGLAKFSKSGVEAMKAVYHLIERERPSLPFQSSPSLEKAYLNDMLQELIDTGNQVNAVDINDGWIEIDTPQDLAKARERFSTTG